MKIVSLLGSPRKTSNSSALAGIVTDVLAKSDDTLISHNLNKLSFSGCQGCGACKTSSEECILKDELTPVLRDVQESDVLIIATPVYWGDVTAQMKAFIDRSYSFLTPNFMTSALKHRLPPGKKMIFIQTQGGPDENQFADIFTRYNGFWESLQFFSETHLIRGCGLNESVDVHDRKDLTEQARKTAISILGDSQ